MVNRRTLVSRRPIAQMNVARKPGSRSANMEFSGSMMSPSIPDEPAGLSDLDVCELADLVYRLMQDDLRTHCERRHSWEV